MKLSMTAVLLMLSVAGAHAATLPVDGTCTLADAIVSANTDTATGECPAGDTGEDTIVLDAAVSLSEADSTATLFNGFGAGLPDVTDDLVIVAGQADVIARDPSLDCEADDEGPFFRFFHLIAGTLTLEGLRLEGGCLVGNGFSGGMIRAEPSTHLILDTVTIPAPRFIATTGEMRGGVLYSLGDSVTVLNTEVDGLTGEAAFAWQGGAIYIDGLGATGGGLLTVTDSTFSNFAIATTGSLRGGAIHATNQEIDGGTFEDFILQVAGHIEGGGVHNDVNGNSTFRNSFFRRIEGQRLDVPAIDGSSGNGFGGGLNTSFNTEIDLSDTQFSDIHVTSIGTCRGGALYIQETSTLTRFIVEDSSCESLESTVLGGGAAIFGTFTRLADCVIRNCEARTARSSGLGGGILTAFPIIERCAILDNRIIATDSDEAVDARGGGIGAFVLPVAQNVVVAGNMAVGSTGTETGSPGGSATGGGIMLANPMNGSNFDGVTIANNFAVAGKGGDGQPDGVATAGGLTALENHSVLVASSILSGNGNLAADGTITPSDCRSGNVDRFLSLGHNVVGVPEATCDFVDPDDLVGVDPGLYAVADFGCLTPLPDGQCVPALAIDQTSPAADAGSCRDADFIEEDIRGFFRPFDLPGIPDARDGCDSGAFEAIDEDGDGFTEAADCAPMDPAVNAADRCGVCDGDGTSCLVFEDGFESGDTMSWSATIG